MKLGEPFTSPGLEGILSCASVPMQLHVPSGFARRARSEMSTVQILPQGVLQLPPWWEIMLDLEGIGLEPGWARALPRPHGSQHPMGAGPGPNGLEHKPQGYSASPSWNGSLQFSWGHGWGTQPALLSWFHFSTDMHALVRGLVGHSRVKSHYWTSPTPSQVCVLKGMLWL